LLRKNQEGKAMLQVLLIAVMAYLALKCVSYKISCYALTMFFLEHGAKEPDDMEFEEYRQKVLENIVKDILHKSS